MKWPWVSRAVLDDAEGRCRELTGRAFVLSEQVERERTRYDALLDKYHALKIVGAGLPPEPRTPAPPNPVTQAIIAKSHGNPTLLAHHRAWANEQQALGVSETNIALAIQAGLPDDMGAVGVGD